MSLSPFADSKEWPIIVRVSGENHDATTPVSRTSQNYESIAVAHAENCAVRIALDGYRVLVRCPDEVWRTYVSANRTWSGLSNRASVAGLLEALREEAVFTPASVASVVEQMQAWPERADVAWSFLHAGRDIPAFAPHITEAHLQYMKGV